MQPDSNKTLQPTDSGTIGEEFAKSGQERSLERGESVSELDDAPEDLKADQDPNSDLMDETMIEADESPEGLEADLDRDGGAYSDESNLPQHVYSDREFNRLVDSDVHGDSPTAQDHEEVFPTD
jgi:hypothetical protein